MWTVAVAVVAAIAGGCGKKGPPLAPLLRVPAAPTGFTAVRVGDEVFAQLAVPAANVDGVSPADVGLVVVYALTAEREPQGLDIEDLERLATPIGREAVRPVLPVPPPVPEGQPAPPPLPVLPGADQGAVLVFRETLTDAHRTPVPLPDIDATRAPLDVEPPPRPLVAPLEIRGPRRYYFAVAKSPRGRTGPQTPFAAVPLGQTTGPTSAPVITVEETSFTLTWTPAPDARGSEPPPSPDVLPSRSLAPALPATTYDVYEVSRTPAPDAAPALPAALTTAPVTTTEFTHAGVTLGTERCFVIRPVDVVEGIHVRGPASPVGCSPFADVFPPPPPGDLRAVAAGGLISLIWDAASAADLAGYVVLRGEPGSATLTPLMEQPLSVTTYRDEAVKPGVTYVYAVVAVDRAGNRSTESNRQQETAR